MSSTELPPPGHNQAYWNVSALESGQLQLPCSYFVTSAKEDEVILGPALSFLLQHSKTGEKIIFDLGIRKDMENAIEPIRERIAKMFNAEVPNDVRDSLARGGANVDDITRIILSHVHWDHVGNPELFTRARFVVGGDAKGVLDNGWPKNQNSRIPYDLLPDGRVDYLQVTDDWKPIGPFPNSLDFYKDGSLYIIDAPGHLPGHINALVRTSSGGSWLYLAGDSAHDWRLLRGEGEIAVKHHPQFGRVCFHEDIDKAKETQKHIAEFMKLPRTQVILAHDAEWYVENKGGPAFFPGKLSPKL